MTGLLPLLLASLAVASADNFLSYASVKNNAVVPTYTENNVEAGNVSNARRRRSIQEGIAAVITPIDETLSTIVSILCAHVKKIYEIGRGPEPDLDTLTLDYREPGPNVQLISFNLSTAAELIPQRLEFEPDQELFIFVHGFTDNPSKDSFGNVSQALQSQGYKNVLALDASALIGWLYVRSSVYVQYIGEKLGEVMAAVVREGIDPSDIHVIGHSLGAHISSYTGKMFTSLTGLKLGRITGLDPAGPCFSNIDQDLRLNATDAEFVDVIHTDAGVFGLKEPSGQVDYYPNSGSQQPDCQSESCSHSRAWQYFAESVILEDAFLAVKCKDWDAFKKDQCEDLVSPMGFGSENGTTGLYFLRTAGDSPYGLGTAGLVWAK